MDAPNWLNAPIYLQERAEFVPAWVSLSKVTYDETWHNCISCVND
jgi:hypothetical protein